MNGYFPPNVQGVIRLSRMPFPDFGIQVEGGSAAIEKTTFAMPYPHPTPFSSSPPHLLLGILHLANRRRTRRSSAATLRSRIWCKSMRGFVDF